MHKQIAINRTTNQNTSLVSRCCACFCSNLGQLSLGIQDRWNIVLQRSGWGEEDNTIGNQIENEVENIACLSEFNKLSAVNIVEIAEYCTNGMVNNFVRTSNFTKNSVKFTPHLLRLRNPQDSLQIRDNFKLDVRELGYGQKIPAYMFDECRVLQGHDNTVMSVIELRNGKLVTGSADNTIRIWDLDKSEADEGYCRVLEGHDDTVYSVIELRNGKLATGSFDSTIRIWDLDKSEGDEGYCRVLRGHTDWVDSVIELSNGKLATGSDDKTIRIWGTTVDNEETET